VEVALEAHHKFLHATEWFRSRLMAEGSYTDAFFMYYGGLVMVLWPHVIAKKT
jgi:hypothetical protein